MNNSDAITWNVFKQKLLQHPELDLQFKYADNKLVNAAYHITEIKQAPITSVDCGGVLNQWTEIIVQLWVPESPKQGETMKVNKALSIIKTVENMLVLEADATVKIEFGNAEFDTRQMFPGEMLITADGLTVDLRPDAVQCKAQSRGGTCGTEKPKVKLINLAKSTDTCCTPGGGCC